MGEKRKRKKWVLFMSLLILAVIQNGLVFETKAGLVQESLGSGTVTIELHNRNPQDNTKFEVKNMFPGDSITQQYRISTTFRDTVTVHYSVKVKEGYEKLGEKLQLRVTLSGAKGDEVIYEGAVNDFVGSLSHVLVSSTGEKTEELCYEVKAYLPTDTTNEYQNQTLLADFCWWVEEQEKENPENPPMSDDNTETEKENLGNLPVTGDNTQIMWLVGLFLMSLAAIFLLIKIRKKRKNRLIMGMITIMVLSLCLGITTFALSIDTLLVNDNLFETGQVSIDLNGGAPIITDEEFLFEPGMTVVKDFFLENTSSCDVYYRLYVDNVEGGLSDVLEVSVSDDNKILYKGFLSDMSRERVSASEDMLREGEKKNLKISFHLPEERGNEVQDVKISFDLNADAVQALHNPDKQFD